MERHSLELQANIETLELPDQATGSVEMSKRSKSGER
jgi:hypothetical protein